MLIWMLLVFAACTHESRPTLKTDDWEPWFLKEGEFMFGSKMSKIERAIEKKDARKLIALADSRDKDTYLAAITGLGKVGGDDAANYLTTLI